MKVSVIIPYGGDDQWRRGLLDYTIARILCLHPNFEICIGKSDEIPFNRGAARNDAATRATGDIFILWDADTISNKISVDVAVEFTEECGFALPYGRYYNLTEEKTREVLKLASHHQIIRPLPEEVDHDLESVAGIICVRRDVFETAQPYREGFLGWGYEDRAAFDLMWGVAGEPYRREDGFVAHLWHPAPDSECFGQPYIQHNRELYKTLMRQNGLPIRVP